MEERKEGQGKRGVKIWKKGKKDRVKERSKDI